MVQRAWRPLQAALQPAPRRDGKGARRRPEAVRAFARTRRLGSWQSGRRRKGRQKRWREVIRWDGSSSPFPRPPSSCVYTRDTPNPVWRAEARPAPRPAKSSLACLSCPTSLPAPSRLCSRVPRGRAPPPPTRLRLWGQLRHPVPPTPIATDQRGASGVFLAMRRGGGVSPVRTACLHVAQRLSPPSASRASPPSVQLFLAFPCALLACAPLPIGVSLPPSVAGRVPETWVQREARGLGKRRGDRGARGFCLLSRGPGLSSGSSRPAPSDPESRAHSTEA